MLGGILGSLVKNVLPALLGGGAGPGGLGGGIISQLFNKKGKIDNNFLGGIAGSMFGGKGAGGVGLPGGLVPGIKQLPADLPVGGQGGVKSRYSGGVQDIQPIKGATAKTLPTIRRSGFSLPADYKQTESAAFKSAQKWQNSKNRPKWLNKENVATALGIVGNAMAEREQQQAKQSYLDRVAKEEERVYRGNVQNWLNKRNLF